MPITICFNAKMKKLKRNGARGDKYPSGALYWQRFKYFVKKPNQ